MTPRQLEDAAHTAIATTTAALDDPLQSTILIDLAPPTVSVATTFAMFHLPEAAQPTGIPTIPLHPNHTASASGRDRNHVPCRPVDEIVGPHPPTPTMTRIPRARILAILAVKVTTHLLLLVESIGPRPRTPHENGPAPLTSRRNTTSVTFRPHDPVIVLAATATTPMTGSRAALAPMVLSVRSVITPRRLSRTSTPLQGPPQTPPDMIVILAVPVTRRLV